MATFDTIAERAAPAPPRPPSPLASRMRQYEAFIGALKRGSVGKVLPGPGETPRSVSMRVRRAGTRLGRVVDTWVVDGIVYCKPSR